MKSTNQSDFIIDIFISKDNIMWVDQIFTSHSYFDNSDTTELKLTTLQSAAHSLLELFCKC